MQAKAHYVLLILAGMMTLSLSAARLPDKSLQSSVSDLPPGQQNFSPSHPLQNGSCMAMLQAVAQQAGLEGTINSNSKEYFIDGRVGCNLAYDIQIGSSRGATSTGLGLIDIGHTYENFSQRECRNSEDVPNGDTYLFDFHGYDALMETFIHERSYPDENGGIVHLESQSIFWYMDGGGDYCYALSVRTHTSNVEEYGHAEDPTPVADVLWSVAEATLPLTPPASENSTPQTGPVTPGENPGQQAGPVLPGENADPQAGYVSPGEENPLQPGTPSDMDSPDQDNTIFGVPTPIVLGSFGIPIIGAAAGALVSAVLGALTTSATAISGASPGPAAAKKGDPVSADPRTEELPESPPPEKGAPSAETPDPAAEEKPGQETPWEETDSDREPEPEEQPPAAENTETGETGTEPEKPKTHKKTVTPEQIQSLKDDLNVLNQQLMKEKYYVLNPLQGDPTLIAHGLAMTANRLWDYTGGALWTGSEGLTCEGYVNKTREKVFQMIADRMPGTKVEEVVFYEKSSFETDKNIFIGALDSLDSLAQDNHILTKITLPDGSEWAIDFHQHNNGNGPIMRPWQEASRIWKDYMGSEFKERSRGPKIATPKPKGKE